MNTKIFLFLLIVMSIVINCSDSEEELPGDFVFQLLVSEKDSIIAGEQTQITATATGDNLEYVWSADAGRLDPTGKPYQVLYSAGECELGIRKVSCKVAIGSKKPETKDVYIVVYD